MKAELEKLVALQNSDANIKRLKKAIQTVPERRATLEQEFERRAFQIRELETQRDAANAERLKFEKDVAEAAASLERAERNLKNSQNQKQYEAAMREKTALQKQIGELETKLLEKTEILETAEKALHERADEIASLETERASSLQEFETQTETDKGELEVEQKRRADAFANLPKNLAAVYNRLVTRIRDGVAVAEVKNGACSACFMTLRPQMLVDIRIGDKIMTCESCNRILYFPRADAPQVEAAGK